MADILKSTEQKKLDFCLPSQSLLLHPFIFGKHSTVVIYIYIYIYSIYIYIYIYIYSISIGALRMYYHLPVIIRKTSIMSQRALL